MRRWVLLGVGFGLGLAAMWSVGAARAEPATDIDDALQNVTALIRPSMVGYATVFDGNKFVQCRRTPDRQMRCEAAGALMQPSLGRVLTGERLNRLAQLGWALDPAYGTYVQTFPADKPTEAIARHILTTLIEGYGAKAQDIETATAWFRDVACPPRSGFSQNLAGSVNDSVAMRSAATKGCAFVPPDRGDATLTDQSLDELRTIYGGRLKAEIQRLRLNRNRKVWAIFETGIGYVQCMPDNVAPVIYCEAQSADSWPALSAVLTKERVAILQDAGYAEPGRVPNYWKEYAMTAQADAEIADEILRILHDVYGYTGKVALKTRAEQ